MRRGWNKVKVGCMSRETTTVGLMDGLKRILIYNIYDKNAQSPFGCLALIPPHSYCLIFQLRLWAGVKGKGEL